MNYVIFAIDLSYLKVKLLCYRFYSSFLNLFFPGFQSFLSLYPPRFFYLSFTLPAHLTNLHIFLSNIKCLIIVT